MAEEVGSDATSPVIGTQENLTIGEDGTLRYQIEPGVEIENAWVQAGEDLYYFDNTGRALSSMLREMNGRTYYFDENGVCRNGLVSVDGDLYFFTPALGMNVGWVSAEGEEDIYYFNEDGKAHKGFLEQESEDSSEPSVFYFDDDGRMHTGWMEVDGGLIYFNEDGIQQLRWTEIEGEWYYFKEYDNGYLATDLWLEKEGKRVYVIDSGMMAHDMVINYAGMDYRVDSDGTAHPLWLTGIRSNWCYLLVFALTTLLIYIGSRMKNRTAEEALGLAAVILLTLLAACRSTDVGTDVNVYIVKPFNQLAEDGSLGFFTFMKKNILMEPLFNVLMYVSAAVVRSPHFALGVISLLINWFVYAGIKVRNTVETRWFAWLFYCLVFFNTTLNIMRQYVAVAILFYLFSDSRRLSWKRVILLTLLAFSFHYVGVIIIPFYIVYLLIHSPRIPRSLSGVVCLLVTLIPPIGPMLLGSLMGILIEKYPEAFWKYTVFVYGHEANNGFTVNGPETVLAAVGGGIILLEIIIAHTRIRQQKSRLVSALQSDTGNHEEIDGRYTGIRKKAAVILDDIQTYLTLWLMDLNYALCSNKFNNRFQYCFSIFRLEYFVRLMRDMRKGVRITIQVILCLLFLWYWMYSFIYLNSGRTSPYLFWFEEG